MRKILTGNDHRNTPNNLINWARHAFGFNLDVCATQQSRVTGLWFGPDQPNPELRDALTIDWKGYLDSVGGPRCCWMNPPYSRGSLMKFLEKADIESYKGVTTVALLPVDTSTGWYHMYCEGRPTLYIRGRLKFGPGYDKPAPFASMLVLFFPPLEF
jgi:hypothetical protein